VFALLAAVVLAAAVPLTRRGLTSTAETLAAVGLIFVLLTGYAIWTAGAFGGSGVTAPVFAGIVCLVAAGVAAGYREISHLIAPRFAGVLLLQPVLPLIGHSALHGAAGWASLLAGVAAQDFALSLLLRRRQAGHAGDGTPYLRDAVWLLHGLAVLASLVCAVITLSRAHTVHGVLAGSAALLLAAVVGMAGGLMLHRWPLPDVGTGLATAALIVAVGRLGAVLLPGWGLVLAALTVLAVGVAVRFIDPTGRVGLPRPLEQPSTRNVLGPRLAGSAAAGVLAVVLLGRGLAAIIAPLRAATPAWHADLSRYPAVLADAAGHNGWSLALAALLLTLAAVVMLPPETRSDGAVTGLVLTLLLAPAGFALPWSVTPVLLLAAAIGLGGYALIAPTMRSVWVRLAGAAVLGGFAAGVSLARPAAGALALTAIVLAGAAIGMLPMFTEGSIGPFAELAAEAGWGSAAFALPGAVAFATVGSVNHSIGPVPVLAASFLAVAGSLGGTAIAQVARGRTSPLMAGGATLGAVLVAAATFRAHGVALADTGVAALLLISAVLLCLAPSLNANRRTAGALDGSDLAAIAVTAAGIAAVVRVGTLLAPRYGLAVSATLVLLVAIGVRTMPAPWRRGPALGASLVGTVVALVAGVVAVRGALAVLGAGRPIWHADLAHWSVHAPGSYGGQIPVALLLLAVAAAIGLPAPAGAAVSIAALGLAALGAPASLGLSWWSPVLLSGLVATGGGLAAAATRSAPEGWARAGVATLLFADTVGASLVRPDITALTLLGATLVLAAIAVVAARSRARFAVDGLAPEVPPPAPVPTPEPRTALGRALRARRPGRLRALAAAPSVGSDHLLLIGGSALAAALITVPGVAYCLAYTTGQSLGVALTAALAGLCVGLALVAVAGYSDTGRASWLASAAYLPFVSAGVAVVGTAIAVGTIPAELPMAIYAATAALLAVLAELLRAAVLVRHGRQPNPDRRGYPLLLAAGPPTVLAIVALAPSLLAALFGPYRWVDHVWAGAPTSSVAALGLLRHWVGGGDTVVAALLLTIAAALGAIGFGGQPRAILARAVAVVIPGIAITMLIAPYTLHSAWPAGPVAAILVAALTGLGVGLSATPPETTAAGSLHQARRLVLAIWLLAGGAGLAGSLADRQTTIWVLFATVAAGTAAALYGNSRPARIVGWLVTATAGHLLALVVGLAAGLPVYWTAFVVGAVATALLMLASLLPRLRYPEAIAEASTIEASAYAGAVLGLLLAARSLPHLAVFSCAWGAVLGVAAARPARARLYRRVLIWTAAAHELIAWWLLMHIAQVALPEAYTLAVALVALITGYVEARRHPEISSWLSYGVALVAAFLPSLAIVLSTGQTPLRRGLLIVAAAGIVVFGAVRRQQAPVVVGGVVLAIAALNELAAVSTAALLWTVMALVGGVLVGLGANYEKRRRDISRLRGALGKLR
jgi:hypothetical protein